MHATLAGVVPVLSVSTRSDFEALVQALTARNEPVAIPPAMGACLVNGLNNWDRINTLRTQWEAEAPTDRASATWAEEFRRIIRQPELYKDRFVILSRGPYSGVGPRDVGLTEEQWDHRSFDLRREHECTHTLSLRVFGALRHDLLEELIADWVALIAVYGEYRPDLALRFLGLEAFPDFREGGRLEVYRGDPPLSNGAFALMQKLAWHCITHLEQVAIQHPLLVNTEKALGRLALALSTMPTETVAAPDGVERVVARCDALEEALTTNS
jgi:hypothetical protein